MKGFLSCFKCKSQHSSNYGATRGYCQGTVLVYCLYLFTYFITRMYNAFIIALKSHVPYSIKYLFY